jgi:leader peptidase (prepilin peptidase)/N-methyltransferase
MQFRQSSLIILAASPFIGSFLGVLIRRLPEHRPVTFARSCCEVCGGNLTASELVPLVSYVLQRGRCRRCGAAIEPFHLMVEVAAVLVAAWAVTVEGDLAHLWIGCLLGWTLLTLGWIDIRCMCLPDALTLPLLLAGLALSLMYGPGDVTAHATGAAAGYLGLRAVAWSYRIARGREGIGGGDAKLMGAAGAWLGAAALPYVLLIAALLGLAMAMCSALMGRRLQAHSALPFGPCLALAIWLIWLYGSQLMQLGGGV